VIVNSAGDAELGALADVDDEALQGQLDALLVGPLRLSRLALRHQRERGHGRIVNVSSTLATTPLPFTGAYAAAKAGLDAATEVLALEVAPEGIDVIRVECGPVRTPAWDHAADSVRGGDDAATEDARARWATLTDLAQPLFADPDAVGALIADAALDEHPKPVYRIGPGSHLDRLVALVPDRLRQSALGHLFGLRPRPSGSGAAQEDGGGG
jgi:NAD(P)-dependent dehydrogenase (short-subunit alcohol dehydrogenase family)